MPETLVTTISAGSHPIYDILVTEKGSIRIRHCEDHGKHVDLISSVIPDLTEALRQVRKIAEAP